MNKSYITETILFTPSNKLAKIGTLIQEHNLIQMPCVLIQPGAVLKTLDIRHYTIGKQYRQKNNWLTIIILAATFSLKCPPDFLQDDLIILSS